MSVLDDRLLRITIEIGGALKTYENLYIAANGMKYGNGTQGEAKIVVGNLTRVDRDWLMTQTSPFNNTRTPKRIKLEAGRASTGYSTVFEGDIWRCSQTQPPDVMMTFECRTGQFLKGEVTTNTQPSTARLSKIAADVATDLGMALNFHADDKQIGNYSFSGPKLKQVDVLGASGGVSCFVDNNMLIVKNKDAPIPGPVRILSESTGLIGIPDIQMSGVKATFFYDHTTRLGGPIRISCAQVPAANGDYQIYKLGFNLANRETPFYWIAEAARYGATQ